MSFRIELFVADVPTSIRFYRDVLGFELERRESDYASLRRGAAVLGLGPIAKLSSDGPGPGFTRQRLSGIRGAGVEVVLEVDDVDAALERVERSGHPLAEPVQLRPWGLRDFRLADPDGYYLREQADGEMAMCGYTWAMIIDRLAAQASKGERAPYFTAGAPLPR